MPLNPDTAQGYYSGADDYGGILYRMEYQTSGQNLPQNLLDLHDFEVPCAVCQRISAADHGIMIPGIATTCPSGFTLDYYGYLFGPHTSHNRGEWLCFDINSEPMGSADNEDGYLMYSVEAYGLPSYTNYRELSCAVCRTSKYGSFFTRWGASSCPSSTTTIYSHRAAGAHYQHSGGGIGFLCLHPTPQWLHSTTTDSSSAQLYQVEYETSPWSWMASLQNYEMACAVCGTSTSSNQTVTISGRTSCPSGFTMNYNGYLAGSYYTHYRAETFCLDASPVRVGTSSNENGALVYLSETWSGTHVFSSNYKAFYEVACVSCRATSASASFQTEAYIAWGQKTCPSGHNTIYGNGIGAGGWYQHRGSSATLLCLHPSPQYLSVDTAADYGNIIYRAEYEMGGNLPNDIEAVHNQDVPCAMCQRPVSAAHTLMIPGKAVCPAGFSIDYVGMLMSESHDHYKSTFVCVTRQPQGTGSTGNENGLLFYVVEAQAPLPSGYAPYYELPCVVCSPCDRDVFSDGKGACGSITECGPGFYQLVAPTASTDRVCTLCGYGSYQSRSNFTGSSCTAFSTCSAGKYQSKAPSYTSDRVCTNCGTNTYSDQSGSSSCKAVSTCGVGKYSSKAPTTSSDRVCSLCSGSTYQDKTGFTGTQCTAWSMCGLGQRQTVTPTSSSDRQCESCPSNTYQDSSSHSQTSCKAWTNCGAGTYVSQAPTSSSQRECSDCSSGKYQSQQSHTSASCLDCSSSTYQDAAGQSACKDCSLGYYRQSASVQAQCELGYLCPGSCARQACAAGTYQDQAGQRTCKTCPSSQYQDQTGKSGCKACDVGYYRSSASSQTQCESGYYCGGSCARQTCAAGTYQDDVGQSSCKNCPSNAYQDQSGQKSCKTCSTGYYRSSASSQQVCPAGSQCSGCLKVSCVSGTNYTDDVGQTSCKAISRCGKAQRVQTAATASSDTVCTSCGSGTYQDSSSHLQSSCKTPSTCLVGTYVSQQVTLSSDRQCSACDGATGYQDQTNQAQCKTVQLCQAGQYASKAPTSSSNRVCTSCVLGSSYQSATSHSQSSCIDVQAACAQGKYQSAAATLTSDRVCSTCGAGKFQDLVGQTSCKTYTVCGEYRSLVWGYWGTKFVNVR